MDDFDRQAQVWAIILLAAFGVVAVYCIGVLTGAATPVDLPWQPEGLR